MKAPDSEGPVNIQDDVDSFFSILDFCYEAGIGGLMARGRSREAAEREWARLQFVDFQRRERPAFSSRFPEAGLWRGK